MRPKMKRKPGYRRALKFGRRLVKKINKIIYKYWLLHPEQYSDPTYIAAMDTNTGKPYILHLKYPVKFKSTLVYTSPADETKEVSFKCDEIKVRLPKMMEDDK